MSDVPAGQVELNGARYMQRADGAAVPLELVKEKDRLQDQAVRRLFTEADELAVAIAAFKTKAFADVDALQRLLEEAYKAKTGGAKGNLTLFSFDGLLRIQMQVADLIKFGPELPVAKALIDECLVEWIEGARAELRAIVLDAFKPDKEGQLRAGALLGLRRYEIEDERWKRAMTAIAESIQVIGSKRYIRFSRRANQTAPWQGVSLDIATA